MGRTGTIAALVFLLMQASAAGAQNLERMHKFAQEVFYAEDFIGAAEKYREILQLNPEDSLANYRYTISWNLGRGRGGPLDSLLIRTAAIGKNDKFYPYWLGRIYFINYDAQHAVKYFRIFLDSRSTKSQEIVKEARQFYKNAELLLNYLRNPDDYEIHLVDGVNTAHDELSPVFFRSNNELLFASSAPLPGQKADSKFRVYHSTYGSGGWERPTILQQLGEFTFANANLEVVNEDGKLFMYNKKRGGELFFSEPQENGWSVPREFDAELARTHMRSHFFISSRENRIIFASTELEAQGSDLYESYRNEITGAWSPPVPLPGRVNSSFNEDSPYLSDDEKTLYFSSDRPGFIGGFDVFKSTFDEKTRKWSAPQNMGFPINSPDDEFNFKMNENMVEGYFASNRIHGVGGFDIYYFWEIEKVNIAGTITDGRTGKPVAGAQIKFHPSSYYDESFTSFTGEDGRYGNEIISDEIFTVEIFDQDERMVYKNLLQVKAGGGLAVTLQRDFAIGKEEEPLALLTNIADKPQEPASTVDFVAEAKESSKLELPEELAEETMPEPSLAEARREPAAARRKLVRPNLYYDKAAVYIVPEHRPLLDRVLGLLRQDETIIIEIAGHTDNTGDPAINHILSERRAAMVKSYLMQRGIAASRLRAKGYGENKPMASNDQELEGRELNRRVEFFVVSSGATVMRP